MLYSLCNCILDYCHNASLYRIHILSKDSIPTFWDIFVNRGIKDIEGEHTKTPCMVVWEFTDAPQIPALFWQWIKYIIARSLWYNNKSGMALTYDAYSKTVKSQQDKESEFQLLKDKYQQDMKAIRQEIRREMKEQLAQLVIQLKPEVNKRRIILRHRYPILCHKNLHSIQLLS